MNYRQITDSLFSLAAVFAVAVIVLLFAAGCQTAPAPINTQLDLQTDPAFGFKYASEKDVIYSRTTTDPETGVTDDVSFQALASAAALAQVERDKVAAEASKAQSEALSAAVQALSRDAAATLSPNPAD